MKGKIMLDKRMLVKFLAAAVFLCGALGMMNFEDGQSVFAQEKKEEKKKDPQEGKKGTTIGLLASKGDNFIEVKADGEEKGRKYVPEWKGGAPAQGGGFDKAILKTFSELKVGSRVEVEWVFHERLRALSVKVLKAAEKK